MLNALIDCEIQWKLDLAKREEKKCILSWWAILKKKQKKEIETILLLLKTFRIFQQQQNHLISSFLNAQKIPWNVLQLEMPSGNCCFAFMEIEFHVSHLPKPFEIAQSAATPIWNSHFSFSIPIPTVRFGCEIMHGSFYAIKSRTKSRAQK